MKPHPLATLIPEMTAQQYAELRDDIKANGLRDAITLLDGMILDGRHREKACREAGVEPFYEDFPGGDPEAFVISRNLKRRHLTADQQKTLADARRKKVAQMRSEGMSTRKIAAELGVSNKTVHDDLSQPPVTPVTPEPEKPAPSPPRVTGRDGKTYPAKRVRSKPHVRKPGLSNAPKRSNIPVGGGDESADLRRLLSELRKATEAFKVRGGYLSEARQWERGRRLEVAGEVDALARLLAGIANQLRSL